MITIKYKLNKDIIARTAANFVWELNNCESSIYVINNNRKINGKSLIGVLSGQLLEGSEIKVWVDKEEDLEKVESCFNKFGVKIK